MASDQEKSADGLALTMKRHHIEVKDALASARAPFEWNSIFSGPPATYASEWFEKHGWIKPVLTLPEVLERDTYAGLKKPIAEGITKGSSVSAEDLKLFLHFVLKQIKEEAPKDWVSMGVVIAKKGDKIGPLDLFTLKVEETTNDRAKIAEQEDSEKLPYLILIIGCYRINNENNKFQKEKLVKLIGTKIAEAGLSGSVEHCIKAMTSAFDDQELIKLFSGMDMFYNLFTDSEFARSRVGTDFLRFKDFSALDYLDYLADFMKMEPEDIPQWFVAHSLKLDWNRINGVPHQELDDPFSYTPYMMGLGLAHKCPYSASSNSSLHNFVHLVGCAELQPRSINAHMFLERPMVVDNAIIFYYAMRRNDLSIDAPLVLQEQEPKSTRIEDWAAFMAARRGIVPDHIGRAVYRIWATIERPREGTVGAFARKQAIAKLQQESEIDFE